MPRKTLARRFDLWGGVSRNMLEVEAGYVRQELESYQLMDTAELAERIQTLERLGQQSCESLENLMEALPDRERLALGGHLS